MARLRRVAERGVGGVLAGWGAYAVICWSRYGRVRASRRNGADTLDSFIADPEIDEEHQARVDASAAAAMKALRELDVNRSPLVWLIFNLRTLPARMRGGPVQWEYKGLVDQMLAIGWGVLVDIPDRLFVAGAVTQPWKADVQFQALPPGEFERFEEAGYVKIVWTLEADELPSGHESIARTRIRVKTTDPSARRRFRRYWAALSPGIILVHHEIVRLARREIERRNLESGRC